MKLFSLATGLLALAAFVSAQDVEKRLVDISDTELEVKEVHDKPNVDSFVVTVQRTDDLLDDDGTFLAERVMSVAFNFDVLNHQVLLNNVALPLNDLKETETPEDPISVTVTVEADVVVGPALDPETKMDDLMNSFDKGLVTVQVTAATEFITAEDGSIVRRLTLQETIVEVNGQEMVQTDAAQQVIEILADGTMGSYTPIPFGKNGCHQAEGMMDIDEAFKSLDGWFRSLNWPGLVCAGVMALFVSLVSATVLRVVVKRRQARYARVQQEDVEEFVQVSVVDDKKFVDEKRPLH